MLLLPVVVGGDRPGADVHVLADVGVAQIREVVLLGSRPEPRVLLLRVVAYLGTVAHYTAGTTVREGTDADVVADLRRLDHARPDEAALADDGVVQLAPRTDGGVAAHTGLPAQDDVRLDR